METRKITLEFKGNRIKPSDTFIGSEGEHLVTAIEFESSDFNDFSVYLAFQNEKENYLTERLIGQEKESNPEIKQYSFIVPNAILKKGKILCQLFVTDSELTEENISLVKKIKEYSIFSFYCGDSIKNDNTIDNKYIGLLDSKLQTISDILGTLDLEEIITQDKMEAYVKDNTKQYYDKDKLDEYFNKETDKFYTLEELQKLFGFNTAQLTQKEYNDLEFKDDNTLYSILNENNEVIKTYIGNREYSFLSYKSLKDTENIVDDNKLENFFNKNTQDFIDTRELENYFKENIKEYLTIEELQNLFGFSVQEIDVEDYYNLETKNENTMYFLQNTEEGVTNIYIGDRPYDFLSYSSLKDPLAYYSTHTYQYGGTFRLDESSIELEGTKFTKVFIEDEKFEDIILNPEKYFDGESNIDVSYYYPSAQILKSNQEILGSFNELPIDKENSSGSIRITLLENQELYYIPEDISDELKKGWYFLNYGAENILENEESYQLIFIEEYEVKKELNSEFLQESVVRKDNYYRDFKIISEENRGNFPWFSVGNSSLLNNIASNLNNTVSGNFNLINGERNKTSGLHNGIFGYNNTVYGSQELRSQYTFVYGENNTINAGTENCIIGSNNNLLTTYHYTASDMLKQNYIFGDNNNIKESGYCATRNYIFGFNNTIEDVNFLTGSYILGSNHIINRRLTEGSLVRGNFSNLNWGYLDIIGNGTSDNYRSNAYTLDHKGNAWFSGTIYCGGSGADNGGNYTDENTREVAFKDEIPKVPTLLSELINDSNFVTKTYVDDLFTSIVDGNEVMY